MTFLRHKLKASCTLALLSAVYVTFLLSTHSSRNTNQKHSKNAASQTVDELDTRLLRYKNNEADNPTYVLTINEFMNLTHPMLNKLYKVLGTVDIKYNLLSHENHYGPMCVDSHQETIMNSFDNEVVHVKNSKLPIGFSVSEHVCTHFNGACGSPENPKPGSCIDNVEQDTYTMVALSVAGECVFQNFFDQMIPRLMLMYDVIMNDDVMIAIPASCGPQVNSFLSVLNILNVKINRVEKGKSISSKRLINVCHTPVHHPALYQKLQRVLGIPDATYSTHHGDVIMLVKKSTKEDHRDNQIVNYSKVKQFLRDRYESRFKECDINEFEVKSLKIQKQFFQKANIVIAVTDVELWRMVFCPKKTSIVELVPWFEKTNNLAPPDAPIGRTRMMAASIGHRHWRILAHSMTPNGSCLVSPENLATTLDAVELKMSKGML